MNQKTTWDDNFDPTYLPDTTFEPENTLRHQCCPTKRSSDIKYQPEITLRHQCLPTYTPRHRISTGKYPETSIFTQRHRISTGKYPETSTFNRKITLRHQFWHGKKAWDIHREPKRSSLRLKFWLENTLSHQRWIRNDRDTLIVTQHTPWDIINFVPENTARRAIPAEKKLTLTYHSPWTSILTHKRPETSVLSQKTPWDINFKPVNTLRQQFWRGKKPETSTVTQRTLWYINFT